MDTPAFVAEGVHVSVGRSKSSYLGHVCTVVTPQWRTSAESMWSHPHLHIRRLSLKVRPRVDLARQPVSPHGILGQTFDGDGLPIFGERDDYTTRGRGAGGTWSEQFTTSAQGRGAIEGSVGDYEMPTPFATSFRFSRFDAVRARPRDTSQLRAVRFCSDLNFGGGDIVGLLRSKVGSALQCHRACERYNERKGPTCFAFSHIVSGNPKRRACWLKTADAPALAQPAKGVISGVVKGPFMGSCGVLVG